jgi:cytochrome c oxidase cbb3-type subunit IV
MRIEAMSYDVIAAYSQLASLLLFVSLFVGVIAYAFWPGNAKRFDSVQKQALELEPARSKDGGR